MLTKLKTLMIALLIILITVAIIIFPKESLHASIHGLHTWWEIVFPSLLPFFILAELLISFGVVQFFGVLFEPVMRPLFNVSGVGSFAWLLGMVSGFPSGAKITVLLRERNEITRVEAERLVSFSNASSPLFIFGAIAVGFFHSVQLGIIIALCHYTSNLIVGLLMKYYRYNDKVEQKQPTVKQGNIIKRAFNRMHQTRIKEKRPFGEILGDAVLSSVQTLLIIGGFIILFSVFTRILSLLHIMTIAETLAAPLMNIFQIPTQIIGPLTTGIFEITMGAEALSKLSTVPLIWQLAMISFILGFNGFSIQAQVASLLAKTDIRFYPYFIARLTHACIASILTIIVYSMYFAKNIQTMETTTNDELYYHFIYQYINIIKANGPIITIISLLIVAIYLLKKIAHRLQY